MALAVLLAGCHRDPNVTKRKYLESGDRYYAKAKYREAAIQYQNAIKVDPKYAEAHYQLAQCYLRLVNLQGAYRELSRAIDQKPDDPKPQIALGNLLLAVRRFPETQQRAELVLKIGNCARGGRWESSVISPTPGSARTAL
jgi:tetratricopeptide (TPR) repeat protein